MSMKGYHDIIRGMSIRSGESHSCGCIGPQNGEPVCPCRMPAYREEEAGRQALEILRMMRHKPRVRVKAVSVPG